jgi:hypothetical protein
VRAADFHPPRSISDADFETICMTFGIVGDQRQIAHEFLDECVTAFAETIADQRALPSRQADRLSIERAERGIRSAIRLLNQAKGPAAQSGLRTGVGRLGSLVSASWMRRRFPNDGHTPRVYYWPHDDNSGRTPARVPARPVDVDDLSLDERIFFAKRRGRDLTVAILAEIVEELEDAHRHIVQLPNGRKPLEYRNYLMAALAELWRRLGKRPTSGMRSKFGAFCEAIFEALGWPTEGVNAALPGAISTWRSDTGAEIRPV